MLHAKTIACLLLGLAATAAMAAPPMVRSGEMSECGKWADLPLGKLISGHIGRLMVLRSELNVTDDQKAKIQEIVKGHKPEIAKVAKGIWEKRTTLRDAVLADDPDEQAIRKASDDLGKAIADAAVLASKVAGEVKPVLTTEQREKIKKCRGESDEAMAKFFDNVLKTE